MARPKAVQASADTADATHKAVYTSEPDAAAAPATTEPPQGDPPASAATPVAPSPTPAPAGAPDAAGNTPSSAATPASGEDFQHKYNVLNGKYRAEVPRLQEQLETERRRSANLEALLAATKAAAPASPAEAAAQTPQVEGVTQAEIDEYGQEFIDMIGRAAAARVAPLIGDVAVRVGNVSTAVEKQAEGAQLDLKARTLNRLGELVPGFEQLDRDPEFIGWLAQPDPFAGRARQALLSEAFAAGDANRVANFFRAYVQENATVDPAPTAQPAATDTQSPAPRRRLNPSRPLETLTAPGRGPASAPSSGAPNGKRHWSGADVTQFYERKRRGLIPATEAAALEADIFAAAGEGRLSQ